MLSVISTPAEKVKDNPSLLSETELLLVRSRVEDAVSRQTSYCCERSTIALVARTTGTAIVQYMVPCQAVALLLGELGK